MNEFERAYPHSEKIYLEGSRGIRVPVRRISLTGGEPPVDVYDTTGPQGVDVRQGLPALREDWIRGREDVEEVGERFYPTTELIPASLRRRTLRGSGNVTQLHYARRGEITPEMEFIALREGLDAEFVRSEVAAGRAIIPCNINHPESEPMIIGRNFKVKVNANIGNSAVTSTIEEEVE